MGLLSRLGAPIKWTDARRPAANQYVLQQGIAQVLEIFCNNRDRDKDPFLWGDELEYLITHRQSATGASNQKPRYTLSLRAANLVDTLQPLEERDQVGHWLPEYASFMMESTPMRPYNDTLLSLRSVEGNMQQRYEYLRNRLRPTDDVPLLLSTFPLLGVGSFTDPPVELDPSTNTHSGSLFIPDACINPHPRFLTLTQNIRLRRRRKVCIQIPLLLEPRTQIDPVRNIDLDPRNQHIGAEVASPESSLTTNAQDAPPAAQAPPRTPSPPSPLPALQVSPAFTQYYYPQYYGNIAGVRHRYDGDPSQPATTHPNGTPTLPPVSHPGVYMDCMAFGMGCCCLQVTLQLRHIEEARHVYDQLAVLCPVMLALTAATAVQKGLLTDSDVRWMTISASVDDRVDEEVPRIPKSRYDSISSFIGQRSPDLGRYNDCPLQVDARALQALMKAGVDEVLARHLAHLFIRDPLVVYDGALGSEDCNSSHIPSSDHFENIQSTNWQTVRFKPPPAGRPDIGWRVEFRVMEVSMSTFENAAFAVFVVLFARAIVMYNLHCYVPLSVVEINLAKAHRRDAVRERSFRWRVNIEDDGEAVIQPLLIKEIICGTEDGSFKGIAHYVERVVHDTLENQPVTSKLESHEKSAETLLRYVEFVRRKANGELKTTAAFMREFVRGHHSYQNDSRVTPEIASDWLELASGMASRLSFPESLVSSDLLSGSKRNATRK